MKTIGEIIRAKRESKGMSREQLARKIQISPGYLAHIENDNHVPISSRLEFEFKKKLGLTNAHAPLVEKQNKFAAKWYRNYRSKKSA